MQNQNLAVYDIEELNDKLHNCILALEKAYQTNDNKDGEVLLDDLWAHQIELEMRNRELMESKMDLEITRDKYANLYDFSPIGFASFDEKGCIQEINLTACKMLGYDRLIILDKPFSIYLSLTGTQSFFKHLKNVLSSSEKQKIKLTIRSQKEKLFQIELESIRQLDYMGNKSVQSAIIDISDRLAAEQAKVDNEKQLHSIINALPIMVAHIDSDQRYIFTNQTHDKTFVVKNGNYFGKPIHDIIGDEIYSIIQRHIKSTLNGQEVIFEFETPNAENKQNFRLNLIPKFSRFDEINSFFMILTDITIFRKKAMDVMTHLSNSAHEARINLIGHMTAEIAHEINQPLSAIANYSAAGLRMQRSNRLTSEEIIEIFHEVDGQVHRASEIISHLNRFSKKRELQLAETNINVLIEGVLKLMAVDKHWQGLEFHSEMDSNIDVIRVDGIMMEQVIINLLRNAMEAIVSSSQKNPIITLKTLKVGSDIVISISDNGLGMPYDMLSEIFTPFYSTKESGVGLGLSICKWIIESHNGKLWATRNSSNGDGGTTFHIQLPALVQEMNHSTE